VLGVTLSESMYVYASIKVLASRFRALV